MAIEQPDWQKKAEDAWCAGARDGINPNFRHAFIQDPEYMPPFLKDVRAFFKAQEEALRGRRDEELNTIEREARESLNVLKIRVPQVLELSERIEDRLALEAGASADAGRPWQGVSFLSGAEAARLRQERETMARFHDYNQEIEKHARSLDTVEPRYVAVWDRHLALAKDLLQNVVILFERYESGLLSTHDLGGAVALSWCPPRPQLNSDWFEDPRKRLYGVLPTGVRDSAEQSFLQWLNLFRRDLLPRSIERGDHHDFGR